MRLKLVLGPANISHRLTSPERNDSARNVYVPISLGFTQLPEPVDHEESTTRDPESCAQDSRLTPQQPILLSTSTVR
jgi:hypothetical protein